MKVLEGHVLRDHVLIGGLVAWALTPVFGGWGSFLFWFSTVMIDIDHIFNFFIFTRFRVFDMRTMFAFFEKTFHCRHHDSFVAVEIFHVVEFLIPLAVLAYWVPALQPIAWGVFFHMAVDFVHLARFKALHKRSHSLIEFFWRRQKLRAEGKDPDEVFARALAELNLPSIYSKK